MSAKVVPLSDKDETKAKKPGGSTSKALPHPLLSAGWFSRISYWWIGELFYKAYKRPLTEDDMYEPLPWLKAEMNADKFEKRWNKLSYKEQKKTGSLFKHLFLHLKVRIALGLVAEFVAVSAWFINPILISGLIQYLDGSGRTTQTQAYVYIVVMVVLTFMLVPVNAFFFASHYYTAMVMRTTCTAMIYKKVLTFPLVYYIVIPIMKTILSTYFIKTGRREKGGGLAVYVRDDLKVNVNVLTISNRACRQVSAGHIVTLMSTDVEVFHQCMNGIHALVFSPMMLVVFFVYGAMTSGLAILSSVGIITLYLLIRLVLGKYVGNIRRIQEELTSTRVNLMSEIITAMRVIKMYCWEKPFAARAKQLRRLETKQNLKRALLMMMGFSATFTIEAILAYFIIVTSYLIGQDITPQTSVMLIGWLKAMHLLTFDLTPFAFGFIFETMEATERIKKFLMCDNFTEDPLVVVDGSSPPKVELLGAAAAWDSGAKGEDKTSSCRTLTNINLLAAGNEFIGITGKVGSGKTSLLMAILGELELSEGKRRVCGSVAYVPQEPWVLPYTIRKNVLLDAELDQKRYNSVLKACTLDVDIKRFSLGDLTLVGERGLSLSGGQKARLNLARAMYQDADIYLFDDPLAAVDDQVGQHIVHECMCQFLKSKLRILVTHNLHYLPLVDKVVVIDEGKVVLTGGYRELSSQIHEYVEKARGEAPNNIQPNNRVPPQPKTSARFESDTQLVSSSVADTDRAVLHTLTTQDALEEDAPKPIPRHGEIKAKKGIKKRIIMVKEADTQSTSELDGGGSPKAKMENQGDTYTEKQQGLKKKKTGRIAFDVYRKFSEAGYGKVFVPLLLLFLAISRLAEVSSGWLLAQWRTGASYSAVENITVTESTVSGYSNEWFLLTLAALVFMLFIFLQLFAVTLSFFVVRASRQLYNNMFDVIVRAPMYFYETNPVGQILNRFSRDTGFMDIFFVVPLYYTSQVLSIAAAFTVFACVIFPWMIVVSLLFLLATGLFLTISLRCIRDVKRIESSFRSPTFSHLSATIQGLSVIRAFRKQNHFLSDAYSYLDTHSSAWQIYLSAQRYLGIRIDFFASIFIVIYVITTVVLNGTGVVGAGESGLAFVYLLYLLSTFQYAFQQLAETETVMTSVERIQQFATMEQEGPEHTDIDPPPGWPSKGAIELTEMALTYRGLQEPALGPITVKISPGEKVGVVGRTGAGKSSLFVSLLRMVEPTGSIKIDGIEITKMGLTDLRSNISVIPQDPVLFSGSLRSNLDPFEEFTDEDLWKSLKQVQLQMKVSQLPNGLSAEMGESGSNFSVGEKQLLCMARALLRQNKIIIVDEATANVDNITDGIIQKTLNLEFVDSTVLTIAHRLNTIITYDKIMVLDGGKLIQHDHPYTLLQSSSGMFHKMVLQLGQETFNELSQLALHSCPQPRVLKGSSHEDKENPVKQTDLRGHTNPAFIN